MHKLEPDWGKVLRWVIVLPMFLGMLIFMGAFFIIPFQHLVSIFLQDPNLQQVFAVKHFYTGFVCYAVAIYMACITAPSHRIAVSVVLMIPVLLMIPNYVEKAREAGFYGDADWKVPYLVTLQLAGVLLPMLLLIVRRLLGGGRLDENNASAGFNRDWRG